MITIEEYELDLDPAGGVVGVMSLTDGQILDASLRRLTAKP
jgi:hypothetical protein